MELTVLFAAVFAATFLLSKAGPAVYGAPLVLVPQASAMTRLMLQSPDEQIAIPFLNMRVRDIGDSWHEARSGHRKHEGQDIFAPLGTPIYSATNGIVFQIASTPKGGKNISVLGAGSRIYYYAHLSRFAEQVKLADRVTPDTVIGYVGITGNAVGTPPHLHFGVYDYAGAMNPLLLLANRQNLSSSRRGSGQ